eukprot:COSAG04_NODE_394_length_15124_cov_10.557005_11_plen_83_part_00
MAIGHASSHTARTSWQTSLTGGGDAGAAEPEALLPSASSAEPSCASSSSSCAAFMAARPSAALALAPHPGRGRTSQDFDSKG